MSVSDAELKHYLAGDADDMTSARIEAALANDPDLERRLMALDDMSAEIRETMVSLPDDTRVEQIAAAISSEQTAASNVVAFAPARREWRWAGLAAACLIGVFVGWSGGAYLEPGQTDWRLEVAHYQALYTGDTIEGIANGEKDVNQQLAQAANVIGAALPADALGDLADMDLMRAQILGFQDRPLAQIVFRGAGDAPIALCLIRTGADDSAVEVAEMRGLASASWSDDGIEYLLIGGDDADWIAARAAETRNALRGA